MSTCASTATSRWCALRVHGQIRTTFAASAVTRMSTCTLPALGKWWPRRSRGQTSPEVHMRSTAFALMFLAVIAAPAFAAQPACSAPQYRQLDFFAGDWDAYDIAAPDKIVARNTVDFVLDGCVIHEDYRQNDGLHGESYSLYDAARKMWHQSWVTNRGELLLLDGRSEEHTSELQSRFDLVCR